MKCTGSECPWNPLQKKQEYSVQTHCIATAIHFSFQWFFCARQDAVSLQHKQLHNSQLWINVSLSKLMLIKRTINCFTHASCKESSLHFSLPLHNKGLELLSREKQAETTIAKKINKNVKTDRSRELNVQMYGSFINFQCYS